MRYFFSVNVACACACDAVVSRRFTVVQLKAGERKRKPRVTSEQVSEAVVQFRYTAVGYGALTGVRGGSSKKERERQLRRARTWSRGERDRKAREGERERKYE